MDFHLFGALNFAVDLVGAFVDFGADLMSAQFFQDRSCVIQQLWIVADGEDAHLLRREPEREISGVMLDQESDKTFVRAERGAMDAERNLIDVVAVLVAKIETARLCEINLIS